MTDIVDIYTDGACSGNPGPGGWGVLLRYRGHEKELFGYAPETTNNRMEMMAVIAGLRALKGDMAARLHTDSRYVQQGMTTWLPNWKRRGWKTAGNDPVKNEDLWRTLDELAQERRIEWLWVKGHAGHVENERADALARRGITLKRGN